MNLDELSLRRATVAGFAALYWVGVWFQARRVRRQIGRSPNLRPRGRKERALWAGWCLVVLGWAGQAFLVRPAAHWGWLELDRAHLGWATLVAGLAFTLAGYAGTLWCYVAMGDTWRIGIDKKEKNALVTRGPYRWVRHPIYLFQLVMLAGAAMLLPTGLAFGLLLLHWVCVQVKAVDEETYLVTVHGEAYRGYLGRTGRLMPLRWRRS